LSVYQYSKATNFGFSQICNAHTPVQAYDPDVSAPQTLVSAADEAEVRGFLFGFLQLLSKLAPSCGLSKYATMHPHMHHVLSSLCRLRQMQFARTLAPMEQKGFTIIL